MGVIIGLIIAVAAGYGLGFLIKQQTGADKTLEMMTLFGIGYAAGWLSGLLLGNAGVIRDTLAGVAGAFVGAYVLRFFGVKLGISNPILSSLATATIGAFIVTLLARLLAR
ncbi:MAG: hypothetical protein RL291_532 [Pseudomonadota bacterium]|jgi:uncharacterized membrane protein YeaQ/YmgE (transglycosylase-associated protein family)